MLIKRVLDILVAAVGLVLAGPWMLIIALLIKLDTPGPVFFRGSRLGLDGRIFDILKFRTMYECPESYKGPRVTAIGDTRITRLGKWLRDTKINEIPQLWNVLRGEMSLVGPRPEDPQIAAGWPEHVRQEILSVRPGITSPASVAYYDEEDRLAADRVLDDYFEHVQPDKLRLDRLYVRHHNLLTDLDAIFWTLVILLPRPGERKISEGWLFGGPVSRAVRHYVGWFVADFVTALLSVGFVGILWRLAGPFDIGLWRSLSLAVLLALLFSLSNTLLGVKMVSWARADAEDVIRLFLSSALVILVHVGLYASGLLEAYFPLAFIFAVSLLVLALCVIFRYRFRLITGLASRWITFRRRGYGAGERVLIVGAGEGGSFATWLLRRPDFQRLYTVAGIVDDDPTKQGVRYEGFRVLGTIADIPNLVRTLDIDVVFYAITKIKAEDQSRILQVCQATGLKIVNIADVLKSLHGHLAHGSNYAVDLDVFPTRKKDQDAAVPR